VSALCEVERFDLIVIGSGSGDAVIPEQLDGRRAALIESGDFGGTCLNRGCIPSKMFVHTADVAASIRGASRFGVQAGIEGVEWPAIRNRIHERIKTVSTETRKERLESKDVTLFEGRARFTGPHEVVVDNSVHIEGDQIVLATGGRPSVPDVVRKAEVEFHTSDTIMWIDELPSSMMILGGGYVAAEFAHIFWSLGVDITVVTMASTMLETLDPAIASRFTAKVAHRWDLHLNASVSSLESDDSGIVMELEDGSRASGETLLVAVGRQPNTEDLNLEGAGISVSDDGHIVVDEYGRAASGVWALGDVSSPFELKHVANAEARTIAHNIAHADDLRPLPHEWVPAAVFSDPQIASVGACSQDLDGREYVEAIQDYGDTAYGWALRDEGSICKLYADPGTGTLLGAHILGPHASLLITPLIQAVAHGQRVADLARGQYWIHPALSEVVENALLKLPLETRVRSGQVH
jgi:mycothione reductase